jgi:hemerythrin-like domain-containing protein
MKNPIKLLHDEHQLLLSAVNLGMELQKVNDNETYRTLVRDYLLFIRNYTELFHYPKEEDFLYPLLKNRSEKMDEDFMHEICDEHEDFRYFIAEIEIHYANCDYTRLKATMKNYLNEMFNHINRENKIILGVASKLLSKKELEKLYFDFIEFDQHQGDKSELEKDFLKLKLKLPESEPVL